MIWGNKMYYTTGELKTHINAIYAKLKPLAEKDGIYIQLNIDFADETPHGLEGTYCYADKDGYHYRYVERGIVQKHDISQTLFEITYLVMESQIFHMATNYERNNRINNQDSRRIIFEKVIQLFSEIGDDYKLKAESKIKNILEDFPFEDELFK